MLKMSNESEKEAARKSKEVVYYYDKTKGVCTMVDDESDMSDQELERTDKFSDNAEVKVIDPSSLGWSDWLRFKVENFGSSTLDACDSVGCYLANFFGITSPKYQFEIDYQKTLKDMEDEAYDAELGRNLE